MITLRQLRYFLALARHGHFGRAAEQCHVSQPALSVQIQELEAALQTSLIERKRAAVSLTPLGTEIARRAEAILADVKDLEDFARRLMDQRIDPRQANIDWNAFREGQRAPATEAVGSAIVLDEIAKRDQIDVTDDDLDAELQRYAEQAGHSVASIRARLQKDGELGRLAAGLRREKTVAHVMSKAQIRKG